MAGGWLVAVVYFRPVLGRPGAVRIVARLGARFCVLCPARYVAARFGLGWLGFCPAWFAFFWGDILSQTGPARRSVFRPVLPGVLAAFFVVLFRAGFRPDFGRAPAVVFVVDWRPHLDRIRTARAVVVRRCAGLSVVCFSHCRGARGCVRQFSARGCVWS